MFKEGLIKGVIVFFLGVFVGTFGIKNFRPKGAPTEAEILSQMALMQKEKKELITDIKEVLDGPLNLSQETKDQNIKNKSTQEALEKLTKIFDRHLELRTPYDKNKNHQPEKLEGYEKYNADGKKVDSKDE